MKRNQNSETKNETKRAGESLKFEDRYKKKKN